jgi:hypothetical protein
MKLFLLMLTSCCLGGCGTYGEPLLLARFYDSQDPCQLQNNGGNYPSFCGAGGRGRTVIYATPTNAPIGAPIGYTKTNR